MDGECTSCGGLCHDPNGAWLQMSAGLIPFVERLLCPPVAVKGLAVAAVDPLTGFEIPNETTPIKLVKRECWLGRCPHCGWNNRFKTFPLLPVTIKDGDVESEVFVRACPREARLDLNTTYHQFIKMERGTGRDGQPYTQPEWCPVVVNRRLFYYRLHEFMQDFLPHYYKVLWHQAWEQVFTQQYKRLAFLGMKDQPQPHASMVGTAILTKDFAAVVDHDKKFNKTCSHPERSHEWVGVYQCSPYLHTYSDEERLARRKKNRNIRSAVRQKVFAIFAFSKRKGDTVFDQTVVADLVYFMKHGKIKSGSRCEWFYRGERVLGSCTDKPLTDKLSEATKATPLHPELKRLCNKRDRCTGQFQGANAFFSTQEFKARNDDGVRVVDNSQTSCHGKSYADGASNTTTGHLRTAAKTSEPVGPGTRGLTLFAADKMRQTPSKKTDSWMCFDDYIVSYYPEDAFEPTRYEAKEGYEGSSKDHFYTNSGLHRLAARHLRCMCSSCMTKPELYSDSCSLYEWCGGVRHYNLEAADMRSRGENVRPSSRILSLEQFATTLGPTGTPCSRVVVCKVHAEDSNELDEPFYLARVVSKARQLDADCLVGGNEYKSGDYVVNIRWYIFIDTSRGDRIYKLQPGSAKGVVYSVESIVRNITGIRFKSYCNGKYTLGKDSVKRLTNYMNKH